MKSDRVNDALTIDKAFSLLGLSTDATEEELKQAYRTKSCKHHPDKLGGDNDAQSKINEAHTIALEYLRNKRGITLFNAEKSLVHVGQRIAQQQAFLRAKEVAENLKKNKTNIFNRLKYLMWLLCAFAGIAALFGETLFPIFISEESEHFKIARSYFASLTFALGISGFILQWIVTLIENQIDAYMAELSDKKACASYLSKALDYIDHPIVDETNIMHSNCLFGRFILLNSILPNLELSSILLQKSLEHGLLEEIEQEVLKPNTVIQYSIAFKPSLFKPQDIPKQESKPMTSSEAKSMFSFAIFLLLLFGSGTIWLVFKKSLWSILTGFLFLGLVGMAMEAISSWRNR